MKKLIQGVTLLILISTFTNCKKTETSNILLGEWIESDGQAPTVWHNYNFKFDCNNNFHLVKSEFTDAISVNDSCFKNPWKEYAAGKYEIEGDILILYGSYTDSLFNPISTGCYNVGNVQWNFEIINNKGQISFKSLNGNRYPEYNREFKIRKTKDIKCD